ncbi:MAG TPA: fused MFS/spermidine synthase [Chloroflexi bacterium]|nr:fused MFS/spermidine synthase [Chloroflexota bacterium]
MRSLYLLVFTAGLVTLGMELSASRLLEPAFGNSQIVWAALIGLILLSLAVGAWLGGWLADRFPRRRELDLILSVGALGVALAPLMSTPVLQLAAQGLATFTPDLLLGALLAVGLLFGIPAILLGTATPWAVRLALEEKRADWEIERSGGETQADDREPVAETASRTHSPHLPSVQSPNLQSPNLQSPNLQSPISLSPHLSLAHLGQTAGRLSAVATAGSLFGAFLPVLWLIPTFGTRWTFYLLASTLLVAVSISAWRQPHRWAPVTALAVVLMMALLWQPPGVRAAWDDGKTGAIIYEDESAFNYIAVRQWGSERHLKLNDGIGIHSVYHPDALLSQGIWDYFLLAPLFRDWRLERRTFSDSGATSASSNAPISTLQSPISNLLLIGAAAGTVPGLYTEIYGSIPITGVELDPQIIAVGQELFDANWPNYTAVAADGRRWLAQQPADARFDVIAIDAYRPPYIPFHLTTVEFFRLVQAHLREDGVVAINVGRTDANAALVEAMAATLQQVFPSVFVIDEPGPPGTLANSLVVATQRPTTLTTFQENVANLPDALPSEFREFAQAAVRFAHPAAPPATAPIFTDDHAQVEQVVHALIWDFMFGKSESPKS